MLCLIFVLLAWPTAFFIAYTLLFAGSAGYLLLAAVKWFRDMRALDREPAPTTTAPSAAPTPAGPERTSR